jgi:hypothetical protein
MAARSAAWQSAREKAIELAKLAPERELSDELGGNVL